MSKIPEWAEKTAIEILQGPTHPAEPSFAVVLALALIEAERRGIERAAERCDSFAKTGKRLWTEDDSDRAELLLAQSYAAQSCAAAIRQLAESDK